MLCALWSAECVSCVSTTKTYSLISKLTLSISNLQDGVDMERGSHPLFCVLYCCFCAIFILSSEIIDLCILVSKLTLSISKYGKRISPIILCIVLLFLCNFYFIDNSEIIQDLCTVSLIIKL